MAIVTGSVISVPRSVALLNSDAVFRQIVLLATVTLPAYGGNPAKTLHLSTPAYVGPDGQPWDGIIEEPSQISAGGAWLTSKWNPIDVDLVLMDKRITDQGVGETLLDLFVDYEWVGARVLLQVAFDDTAAISDYMTIFDGVVSDWREMDAKAVQLYLEQSKAWALACPPRTMEKALYPSAPQSVYGTPIPILWGDWYTDREIVPTLTGGAYAAYFGVARQAAPILPIEVQNASGGTTQPKFIISDRPLALEPFYHYFFESSLGTLGIGVNTVTITSGSPTTMQLVSRTLQAAVIPVEVKASTTTASGAYELIRTDKPTTLEGYCTLDYDAAQRVVELNLPDLADLGTFVSASAYIAYTKVSAGGTAVQWGVKNASTVDNLATIASGATTPSAASVPYAWAGMNVGPVSAGGSGTVTSWAEVVNTTLFAEVRAAGQAMRIHRLTLAVYYKPTARVLVPAVTRVVSGSRTRYNVKGQVQHGSVDQILYRAPLTTATSPQLAEFDNNISTFAKGAPDADHVSGAADGTYTGTPGDLIEHPADVAHWLLREFGEVSASEVTTAVGEFGSFTDARTTLANYVTFGQLAEEREVDSVLEQLGDEVLCWFFRRQTETGSPWVAIPWATGATVNYRSASNVFAFNRIGPYIAKDTFRVSRTSIASVANVVRVNFDYDPRTRTYGEQVFISDTNSRGWTGSAYARDQNGSNPNDRETEAASSLARYGKKEIVKNLKFVKDPATATNIRNRLFDWRVEPRVLLQFVTFQNAVDLERGHVIQPGEDWDDVVVYPKPGSSGSWASRAFQVFNVRRLRNLPTQYAVTAIET